MAAIIFDFDGTIADSFDFIVDFLAATANGPPLTAAERAELRGLSMTGIGRSLGLSWPRLLRSFFAGRRRMSSAIDQLEPFEGMADVLEKVHGEGHELFILTSNSVRNVHKFLHRHNLHEYFLEVYGGIGLFSKAPALRRLLKEQNIERDNAVSIGDEPRDIMAAQSQKIRAIAVTWGFARTSDLQELGPAGLASSPDELLKLLEYI
jgi:phosphoglycolate phosphatase